MKERIDVFDYSEQIMKALESKDKTQAALIDAVKAQLEDNT